MVRVCLKCRKEFDSKGPANRLCANCNRDNLSVRDHWTARDPESFTERKELENV